MNHSSALVYSTRVPVSVCGTAISQRTLEVFLDNFYIHYLRSRSFAVLSALSYQCAFYYTGNTYNFQPPMPSEGGTFIIALLHRIVIQYGNINPFVIGIPNGLSLDTD
jgi:hypothetical protein